jgi:flagellar biosynthesis GTPase FlhF
MILKNIFGKTIEAAKKSARQMYGDDFLVIESSEGDGADGKARITIFSDGKKEGQKNRLQNGHTPPSAPAAIPEEGVLFERSGEAPVSPKSGHTNGQPRKDTLGSLRKFAEQQMGGQLNGYQNGTTTLEEANEPETEKNSDMLYNRSFIRPVKPAPEKKKKYKNEDPVSPPESPKEDQKETVSGKAKNNSFITHFKPSKPQTNKAPEVQEMVSTRHNEREIRALHKRFDTLEALLDSALISANLDYASHPAFQQLVHTGINTSVIAGWFSDIIKKGIDPYDQGELFMSHLAEIIRKALGKPSEEETQKFMLFAGPSGAGKTQLIMKLTQHPDFMTDKKLAVVSVYPQAEDAAPYYTILEPFCAQYEIPYFKVQSGLDVSKIVEDLAGFDHVLIDTPALSTEQDNSFREFWKIRQLLSPLAPLEVHYVVNAVLNRFYFQNTSATHHPLQPDYVAITHLDEVAQWGPVIPFLQKMGCSARYISTGSKLNNLNEFNPQWFAQKVLQEN